MSTAARAPGARPAPADLMTIGEVLGSLRAEFPDVTPSKVRFLEERGLVTPARTPSGYRKFAPAHVARLRLVLTLQRDHYLPLRVIGDHLAALDAGQDPALPPPAAEPAPAVDQPSPPPVPAPERTTSPSGRPTEEHAPPVEHVDLTTEPERPAPSRAGPRTAPPAPSPAPGLSTTTTPATAPATAAAPAPRPPEDREPARPTFAGLVEVAAGDVALVDALLAHGLLPRPLESGDAAAAEQVVRAAAALGAHGIEPRHLRVLRTAAEREAALVEQITTPLRRVRAGDDVDGRARSVTLHLRETLGDLRSALLATQLTDPAR